MNGLMWAQTILARKTMNIQRTINTNMERVSSFVCYGSIAVRSLSNYYNVEADFLDNICLETDI
ncbi:hypothetical protein HZS_5735 [Henneguya salminicola]|nr:hypothetical protein HZS_5735 [Henneguya salminicola]